MPPSRFDRMGLAPALSASPTTHQKKNKEHVLAQETLAESSGVAGSSKTVTIPKRLSSSLGQTKSHQEELLSGLLTEGLLSISLL